MIVLDASAAVEWLLGSRRGHRVDALVSVAGVVAAPHLIDAEVLSVIRRLVLTGALSADRAAMALEDWSNAPLRRYPLHPMLPSAFALRDNVSGYDALYLVLARTLGATLVTGDARLARAAVGHATAEVV